MRHERLLELIWRGDVHPARKTSARRLQRAFNALVPLRCVALSASFGVDRSRVMREDIELLPEITLGDVIAQELPIDVPVGALVLLSDADLMAGRVPDCELSYDLGVLIVEVMLDVIRSGTFPLERETDALYMMACSYHRMIAGSGFRHLGLVPEQFRSGLAAGLCTYWAGARNARNDTSGLFLTPDFLTRPCLLDYLKRLDANFSAPDRTPAGLMAFSGGPISHEDWLTQVHDRVAAQLDAHVSRQGKSSSRQQPRVKTSPRN